MSGVLSAEPPEVDLRSLVNLLLRAQLRGEVPVGRLGLRGIELDSRLVVPGQMFAAMPGHHVHGAAHAGQALAQGAVAILTDPDGAELLRDQGMDRLPILVVPDPRACLGEVSRVLYGDAARGLALLAVTGTNGKTTVAAMLRAGLQAAGIPNGTIGTVGVAVGEQNFPAIRTTPEAPHLHALLAAMRERQVQAVALEVSSHAMSEHRVDGLYFEVSAFTNLTQDHLDYHGTMEEYFQAKAALFTPDRTRSAVVGIDDDWGRRLADQVSVPCWTWSATGRPADWRLVEESAQWWVIGPDGERQPIGIPLPGEFNRANALCAYVVLRRLGLSPSVIAAGLEQVRVPGRMEPVGSGGIHGIVDYAHSPDAIERVIASVRQAAAGRIITVLGAGGDRDQGKRPLMGAAAARLADVVVITDDNPRSEDPALIRAAVLEGAMSVTQGASGTAEVIEVPGRREAIAAAVALAGPEDVVLLLGKGHEQGQEIQGVVLPFDDREVLAEVIAAEAGA